MLKYNTDYVTVKNETKDVGFEVFTEVTVSSAVLCVEGKR
jgi:uncharacterized protein (DUF302 family)